MPHATSARSQLSRSAHLYLLTALWMPLPGCLIDCLGGSSADQPEQADAKLSAGAKLLIDKAFADLPAGGTHDYHVHVLGLNTSNSGTWVNPELIGSWWRHPIRRGKGAIYLSGADIADQEHADRQFLHRLVRLVRGIEGHGKFHILAFDHHYRKNGSIDFDKSEFYVPNEYVFELSQRFPDVFVPVVSVHPYRLDALHELKQWADQGVRMVKWLPNAQGIDASDCDIDPFYRLMAQRKLVLLTHTGEEKAVQADEDQRLGNPLLFRRPLDLGVRVVMAHCASLGENVNFEDPAGRKEPNYRLFLNMLEHECYKGLLYGEISAMTQANRIPDPLVAILERPELHGRLVNGSDYPLPAINVVIRTGQLVEERLITKQERKWLNEIYDVNPLLFDFVLKRTIRLGGPSGQQLSAVIFGPLQLTTPVGRQPGCQRHPFTAPGG